MKNSQALDKYSPKLDKKYFPAVITRRMGKCTYELADKNGKIVGVYHINDLKD